MKNAYQFFVQDKNGVSQPNATITVRRDGNLVPIFSDKDGTPKVNPFQATSDAYALFYADAGTYDIRADFSGKSFEFVDVQIGTQTSNNVVQRYYLTEDTSSVSKSGAIFGASVYVGPNGEDYLPPDNGLEPSDPGYEKYWEITNNELGTIEFTPAITASAGSPKILTIYWYSETNNAVLDLQGGLITYYQGQFDDFIEQKDAEADAVISEYKLKNRGYYLDGPTLLEDGFEYVRHTDGEDYFAVNPPYTTDPVTYPDPATDPNLIDQSYVLRSQASQVASAGDEQVIGSKIYPADIELIAGNGGIIPAGTDILRLNGGATPGLFTAYGGITGTISSIVDDTDFKKTVTADAVDYNLYHRKALENPINVRWFGAVGDADLVTHTGTDDTLAFKAAITFARNFNGVIYAPKCESRKGYLIDDTLFFGPLNATSLATFPPQNICGGLIGNTDESTYLVCGDGLAGKVVLDYTGLGHKYAKDFTIWRNTEANAPAVGILTARFKNPAGGVTGNYGGHFKDVVMFKYFSVACRLAITTEETREERLNIRNDHADSYGCFVSTADGSSESYPAGPTWNALLGEVSESTLLREDVPGSNLHQTHIKCDYYYGNNTPDPLKDPCMLRIDGANGLVVHDPFFNNNFTTHDCVQIRKAGTVGVPYGIAIINPLYHQQVKAGVRVMTGLNRLDLEQSNTLPGFGFDEAELVIDGFLSGATIEAVDSIIQNNTMENSTVSYVTGEYTQRDQINNCEIEAVNVHTVDDPSGLILSTNLSCKTFNWNTDSSIQNSEITVRDTLNATGARGGTPKFRLRYEGVSFDIDGEIPASWIGSPSPIDTDSLNHKTSNTRNLDRLLNRSTDKSSQIIEHENVGFSGAMIEIKAPSGSTSDFNYREVTRGGVPEITEVKGGFVIYEQSSGGVVLTSPGGTKYRLFVDNAGNLLTTVYT